MSAAAAGAEKDRFTSLDTLALARELRSFGRAHVDKAFDLGPGAYSLTLRAPGAGRKELKIVPGRYAALLPLAESHAEAPGPLARELRRLLAGSVVTDVPDPRGERFLEVALQRSDVPEPLTLAIEFFGPGNLLVARGPKIVAVDHPKVWAHRAVRIGAEYVRPPSRGDPWARSSAELAAALAGSRTDRASTLAARLSFGGPIAEELLSRTGLSGSEPAALRPTESAELVHAAVSELLAEVGERPAGHLYRREGVLVDAEPFRSRRWEAMAGVEREETATFSEAADRFFGGLAAALRPKAPSAAAVARTERERQAAQQAEAVASLAAEAAARTADADAIYAHFAEAEAIRAAASAGAPVPERVTATLGDRSVPLLVRRPLEASARELYEEAKRAQAKLAGARAALAQTQADLAAGAVATEAAERDEAHAPAPTRKPHWFERFRWFVSSEGVLCVAGRDAGSNDQVVRRYLKAADRYVHADLHGAASVVVKHPGPGRPDPTDRTMHEAGQFAVAFSKAWRAGLASASAFWVASDQVSKSGGTGEFVARGAWVIHGTKQMMRDLPTELAIGTIAYEDDELWSVAPPAALQSRGRVRFLLTPGEERERGEREIELARELGLSRSRLQSLLPAGGITVRRT
jgi:predicted ribosome quality control (RQC) complex YloA/Tae2 family protein